MPKQKKQPRNAYYFYILDKKKEFESRGMKFYSIKDVFSMENLRQEYKLDPSRRAYYDQMANKAKEADKVNLSNKFTCSGESVQQILDRKAREEMEANLLEDMLVEITMDTVSLDDRNFVLFKTIHTCELNYPDSVFWPVEMAIATFNLSAGLTAIWWTLVDTVQVPTGYASAAKDTYDETRLPIPGSKKFKPIHRNYLRILRNIKNVIEKRIQASSSGYYPIFVMQEDQKCAEGCLRWLIEHANFEEDDKSDCLQQQQKEEILTFFSKLKFLRVSRLLLKLAAVAKNRDANYEATIAQFGFLEDAAIHVMSRGDYNYKEPITCPFHNMEEESIKMHVCCRNVILRTIFIILDELIPHLGLQPMQTHRFEFMESPGAYEVPTQVEPEPAPVPNRNMEYAYKQGWGAGTSTTSVPASDLYSFPTLGNRPASVSGEAFGTASAWGDSSRKLTKPMSSNAAPFTNDDFPSLGSSSTKREEKAWGEGAGRSFGRGRGFGGAKEDPVPGFGNVAPAWGSSAPSGSRGRGRGSGSGTYNFK